MARPLLYFLTNERFKMKNTTILSQLPVLLNLASGKSQCSLSASRSLQLALGSLLASLFLVAIWGAAAGSHSLHLAAASALKVPLIVLLSTLSAIPVTLLVLKLSGISYSGRNLFLSICSGVMGGSLILAALSPIVGVYYHTSVLIGSRLAVLSAFVAIIGSGILIVRNASRMRTDKTTSKSLALPLGVFVVVALAAMLQFVALASPVLPNASSFDAGIDGILQR